MTRPSRRPLVSLGSADVGFLGTEARGLLLGRYDAEAVRGELAEAGLLEALAERGFPDVEVGVEAAPGEHRLTVRARRGRVNLIDLRLAEASSRIEEPLARKHGLDVVSFLRVQWLALQHPGARFTRERPRLPGQRFPGLGLSKPVVMRLLYWARAWGKDALVTVPQYYHNAVVYSALFRFLSPERQGAFEALRRDLSRLSLARASAAVDGGSVIAMPGEEPAVWSPDEMVAPLTAPLLAYLDSADYAAVVAKGRDAARFQLLGRGPKGKGRGHP